MYMKVIDSSESGGFFGRFGGATLCEKNSGNLLRLPPTPVGYGRSKPPHMTQTPE
jgi:hypothetical protein